MNLFRKARMTPFVQFEIIDLRTIFVIVKEDLVKEDLVKEDMEITIVPQMALPTGLTGLKPVSPTPSANCPLGLAVSSTASPPALPLFLQQANRWTKSQGGFLV